MKKAAVIFLLLAPVCARADFVIVENCQSTGRADIKITIKIKGDLARVDVDSGIGADARPEILDTYSYDRIVLIPGRKEFNIQTTNWPYLEKLMKRQQEHPDIGAGDDETPKITDTGKKEKAGDYNAEIYTAETAKVKFTMWVATDVPDCAYLQEEMRKLHVFMPVIPYTAKIDGVAVRTETVKNGGTVTVTMLSVKKTPVDEAELKIPPDYTEWHATLLNIR